MVLPSPATTLSERRREERNAAAYARALRLAGGCVVELRPGGKVALEELGALLFSGGGDISPRRYDQPPHPAVSRVDEVRDEFELGLAREALEIQIPVLGICRGAQVLGVVAGGDLVQDVPSQHPGALAHATPPGGAVARHWVRLEEGSRLRGIMGGPRVRVNSYHHQANATLGPGMRAVAWCEDGVVEAIEGTGRGFVLGVQWHPERMLRAPRQRRLFAALVAAAGQMQSKHSPAMEGKC
jgi:putative glutamine amidotransferase